MTEPEAPVDEPTEAKHVAASSPTSDAQIKRAVMYALIAGGVLAVAVGIIIANRTTDAVDAQHDADGARSTASVALSQAAPLQEFATLVQGVCATRVVVTASEVCRTAASLALQTLAIAPPQPGEPATLTIVRSADQPAPVTLTVQLVAPAEVSTVVNTVELTVSPGPPGLVTITLDPLPAVETRVVVTETPAPVTETPAPVTETATTTATETPAPATVTELATETVTETETVEAAP